MKINSNSPMTVEIPVPWSSLPIVVRVSFGLSLALATIVAAGVLVYMAV